MSDVSIHVEQQEPIHVEIKVEANGAQLYPLMLQLIADAISDMEAIADQDNILRVQYISYEGNPTPAKFRAAINALPNFNISPKDLFKFVAIRMFSESETAAKQEAFLVELRNIGHGNYGTGGTQIISDENLFVSPRSATSEDIENLSNTLTVNLGEIGATSAVAAFNAKSPAFSTPAPGPNFILVKTLVSGSAVDYRFIGPAGLYGAGGTHVATQEQFTPQQAAGIPNNLTYGILTRIISNSNGTGFTLPIVSETNPGLVTPADLAAWYGKQNALGFTPENLTNKAVIPTNETSVTKYPSVKAVVDYLAQGWNAIIPAKATEIHDTDAVIFFNTTDGGKTKTRTWAQLKTTLLSVFQKKDNQIPIGANTPIPDTWDGQTIIFTANCTVTVPATLPAGFGFNFIVKFGVTVTWAITTPHVWGWGTPAPTPEKTYGNFTKEGATNNIILGT